MNAPDSAAGEPTTQSPRTDPSQQASQQASSSGNGAASQDAIAQRAYDLYQRRGGEPGRDMDDWLQAERELSRGGEQPS